MKSPQTRICPVCGKHKSGIKGVSHRRCSKLLQAVMADKNAPKPHKTPPIREADITYLISRYCSTDIHPNDHFYD